MVWGALGTSVSLLRLSFLTWRVEKMSSSRLAGAKEAPGCGGAVSSSPRCYDTTPAKSDFGEKGFVLAHSVRLRSIMSAAVTVAVSQDSWPLALTAKEQGVECQ